jgi:hypothetical protein
MPMLRRQKRNRRASKYIQDVVKRLNRALFAASGIRPCYSSSSEIDFMCMSVSDSPKGKAPETRNAGRFGRFSILLLGRSCVHKFFQKAKSNECGWSGLGLEI